MAIQIIREEIYNENGLIEVRFHEIDTTASEELIKQKEDELLRIYEEIQNLKNQSQ